MPLVKTLRWRYSAMFNEVFSSLSLRHVYATMRATTAAVILTDSLKRRQKNRLSGQIHVASPTFRQTDVHRYIEADSQTGRQTGRRTKGLFIRWCVCTVYS